MEKKSQKKRYLITGSIIGIFSCIILFVLFNAYFYDDFRTLQDKNLMSKKINLTGLREIHASGGALPRFPGLKLRMCFITKEPIVIVNAEDEPMDYVSGIPISLLGYRGKTPELKHYIRRLIFVNSTEVANSLISSEADEARKYGFNYQNIIIHSRSSTPDNSVDEFVSFFDNLPENTWIHFHCHHGQGRTTMMLSMLDILRNAPTVTLPDIVKRQYYSSGVDLFDTIEWKDGSYNKQQLVTRKKFIENFYDFVVQRKAGGEKLWSVWIQQKRRNETIS